MSQVAAFPLSKKVGKKVMKWVMKSAKSYEMFVRLQI